MKKSTFNYVALIALVCMLLPIATQAQAPTTSVPPKSVAISTWQMFRGGQQHHAQQLQKGGFTAATPVLKWEYKDPTAPGNNGGGEGEPAVGDVNGNGITEVVSAFHSRVNVIVGSTGTLLWSYTTGSQINGSPAIGDVDNNGNMDVVVCSDKVYALNGATGTVLWTFTGAPVKNFNSSPEIADVVLGGTPEVIVTCDNGKVYVLNGANGTVIWSYTIINTTEMFWASPVVGDINGDGQPDVVVVSPAAFSNAGGEVIAFNGKTGVVLWKYTNPAFKWDIIPQSPVLADLNQDCQMDVLAPQGGNLYNINGSTGVLQWSKTGAGSATPAIADMDGDCKLEIILGGPRILDYLGNQKYAGGGGGSGWNAPAPRVGDFNPTSPGLEIVLGSAYDTTGAVDIISMWSSTCVKLWGYKKVGHTTEGMCVADIDNDGCVEVVFNPDCCNGRSSVIALDDVSGATNCGFSTFPSSAGVSVSNNNPCVNACVTYANLTSPCATAWTWSFPGGTPSSSTAQTPPSICYNTVGTYTTSIIATFSNCAPAKKDTAYQVIVVKTCGPTVATTSGAICPGMCTNITATGSGGAPPYTYSWNPGSGTGSSFNVCPAITTTYTVIITDNSAATASATAKVTVNPQPTITLSSASVCPSGCANITAGGGLTYSWTAPLTGSSSTQNVCPASTSTYTVTGTDGNGCTNTATATVTVKPLPTVTVTDLTVCKDTTTGTVTASGASTYTWSCGGTGPTITPSSAVIGVSTCTVTGTGANGCVNTAVSTITVKDCSFPTVTIVDGTICNGNCYGIKAIGAGGVGTLTYTWTPNLGVGAGPFNECPTATTTYTVTVSDGNGVTATDAGTITVNPLPTITATGASICNGACTNITASGAGAGTYSWTSLGSGATKNVCPTSTSTYTVTGTDANSCTNTATAEVTVNPIPVIVVPPVSVCPGGSTTMTASGANTYTWSPTTGLSSGTGASVTVTPGATSTYTVCGTSVAGCSSCTTVKVTVGALVATIGPDVSICSGTCTTLSSGGGTIFTWSPSTGLNNPNISNPSACPTVTTTYTVNVSDGTCSDDAVVVVTVKPNPAPVITGTMTICSGQGTTLTANAGGSYTWSTLATTPTISVSPSSNMTYSVIVLTNGCTGSASAQVTVNPTPAPTIPGPVTICSGQSTTLTSSTAGPYIWNSGATTPSITVTPSSGTTTYSVSVTVNGCTGTAKQTVTVIPPVTASITGKNICVGQSTTLKATGGTSYQWNTGASTSTITASPPVGISSYSVIVSVGSCADTATYSIKVNPLPIPIASGDTTILYGQTTPLKSGGGGTYQWIPPGGLNCSNCANPIATPTGTTQYCVIVKDTAGCTDSACVTVIVDLKCGFEGELFVPNGFSPNGDGQNDVLYVRGLGITDIYWAIFDRWGEKVFETTDPKQGWDGTYKGKALDPAVFVYYLKATCITGDEIKKKGNVAIIK